MSPEDDDRQPAILVEGLGKRYRIGMKEKAPETLAGAMVDLLRAPLKNLSSLRRLSRFGPDEGDDVVWALRNVSLEVGRGEVVGVIGRNGAGKSTLLKILTRITEPTEGRAEIHGRVSSLLEVGTGFHQELTGRENIYLNGAVLGMSRREIDTKFDEIVSFSEIGRFLDTPIKRYSSGMKVRLAFAVAAHLEPEILLIDEVLAVGDVAFQKKCLGKMGQVARAGRTVLFVSHDLGAIRRLCPRTLLFEAGELVVDGPTERAIDHYLEDGLSTSPELRLPSPTNGVDLQATRLVVMDSRGIPTSSLRLQEEWSVRLDFEVRRSLPHVIAAVGLKTGEGTTVVTCWSEPGDLDPGHYSVTFHQRLPLAAGVITFAVGLSTYERTIYHLDQVGRVVISDAAVGDQPVRSRQAGLLIDQQRPPIDFSTEPSRAGARQDFGG